MQEINPNYISDLTDEQINILIGEGVIVQRNDRLFRMPEETMLALDEYAIENLSEAGCKLLLTWLGEKTNPYHNTLPREIGGSLSQEALLHKSGFAAGSVGW